jgi:hypothetical protein
MSGEISLAKLIDVLKSDWSVINPARMQDILDRLVVTAEEVQPHALFSEKDMPATSSIKTANSRS